MTDENEVNDLRKQLANDVREIKQAVIGDPSIGLNGLVNDMKEMKQWKQTTTKQVAVVSGLVSGAVVGGKALLTKLFGGS